MNNVKCNICESVNIDNFLKKDNYEILRCSNCGLAFVKDMPSDANLNSLYTDNFFHRWAEIPDRWLQSKWESNIFERTQAIEKYKKYGL